MTITTASALTASAELARVEDAVLLRMLEDATAERRRIDVRIARISGEIARRSTRDRGYDGLAQRSGAGSSERLVQRITGATKQEASALVWVGEMLTGESAWMGGVARQVESGALSIGGAAAIGSGLGAPSATVDVDELTAAADALAGAVDASRGSRAPSPEELGATARAARDDLDADRVGDRERALREGRTLRLIPQADGSTRISGVLDPESAAQVGGAIDAVTAPARPGPRFADGDGAGAVTPADERTRDQRRLDALVDLVRAGAAADHGRLVGGRQSAVRVHVTQHDLVTGRGSACIEGQPVPVSIATAERLACAGGYLPILFDDAGAVMNFGRTRRLFSESQRIALAAIWGGCAVDSCDVPPIGTEAHHLDHWQRDSGRTDVGRGVLLCRHHHLLLHNNGWSIVVHTDGSMRMLPPPDDPVARPIALVRKNPAWRRSVPSGSPGHPIAA